MKRFLVLSFLAVMVVVGSHFTSSAVAQNNSSSQYLDAYVLIHEGDAAKAKFDYRVAYTKYTAAQSLLADIKQKSPSWNVQIIEFRLQYCDEQIKAIKLNLGAQTESVTSGAKNVPDSKQLTQLTEARLTAVGLAQESTAQLTNLKKQNNVLADKLNAAQKQIRDLQHRIANADTSRYIVYTKQPEAYDAALESLKTENCMLTEQLIGEWERIVMLQKQLSSDAKLADQIAKLKTANTGLPGETKTASNLREENSRVALQLAKANERIADLKKQNEEISGLKQQQKELSAKLADQLAKAKTANANLSGETKTASNLREENSRVALQLAKANERIADLKKQNEEISGLKQQQKELSAKLADQLAKTKTANASLADETKNVNNLRQENSRVALQLAKANERIADLKKQNEEISGLKQQQKELSAKLADQLAKTKTANASLADETKNVNNLRQENSRVALQLAKANERIADLQKQLAAKSK